MTLSVVRKPTSLTGGVIDLNDPKLYINRELSWLQFNRRVLDEALDPRHPLLERVKFLAISASNLDEFLMIRVSGLRRQVAEGVLEAPADGMSPSEQLAAIRGEMLPQLALQSACWRDDLLPKLRQQGILVMGYGDLGARQKSLLRRHFEREIFPTLTPLAFDPGHPFPHISNLSLNLAVVVKDREHGERFARLKVPPIFPRLLRIVAEEQADSLDTLAQVGDDSFVWIEDVIAANLDLLFPGVEVVAAYPFRVTRDADVEIEEDEASDLLTMVKEGVSQRNFGMVVRLEVDSAMPERVRAILASNLGTAPHQLYSMDRPIGMASLMELTRVDRPDLKDEPFVAAIPEALRQSRSAFDVVRQRNLLFYHPYDNFSSVVDFLAEAARDPQTLAIKQTLYRVGPNSPIVDLLMEARENGKQVAVLVELKARFDEENNIAWARALEQAGVHVVYGLVGLKTHAKVCLVVRRESDGIVRYVHMSTGNYNAVTGRVYADIGYLTSDPLLGSDITHLFNALTGYARKDAYHKLLVAPGSMRSGIISRIEREIERQRRHGDGYVAFKMNALVDHECIKALYRASQAGVKIDLQVRSICCLRPGVPGVSDNIRVTSIVGRFLEHARIYYFRNGGQEEVFLGSADLMPRNLDRRVEILFPVEDPRVRQALVQDILFVHLRDNVQARRLLPDGSYERIPHSPEERLDSQAWMLEHRGVWNREEPTTNVSAS
ncbi:MAG: polyphosphate kinase 1 [Anaerolineae bacterium]